MRYINICRPFTVRAPLLIQTLIFSILFLSYTLSLNADDLSRINYLCLDSKGDERWTAVAEIIALPSDLEGLFILTEKGKGRFTGYEDRISWTAKLEFERKKDCIRPLKLENRIFDKDGREIAVETQEFDYKNQKAAYSRRDLIAKVVKEEEFKFKGDITNRLLLTLYIQKLLKQGKEKASAFILSTEPRLYKVNIYVVSKEQIDINGKKVQAVKLCIDPEMGLFNIVKVLVPRKAYSWHSQDEDYRWLKYEGPEIGLTSEDVLIRDCP